MPKDTILHSRRSENLKSYRKTACLLLLTASPSPEPNI
jgi:hypothetical protein